MTDLLCPICDYDILNDKNEFYEYLTTRRKKYDKNIYKKYDINNINLDDVDKILNDYINIHNKKFDIYFIKCKFNIKFDNITRDLETNIVYNKEFYKIVIELLFFFDYNQFDGYNFSNINAMTIIIISDICNITDSYLKYSINNPIIKKINIIFAKNPKLLDNEYIKHLFLRKKSHIIFNI